MSKAKEQWDINCVNCGKYILTERKVNTPTGIECINGGYENGFYDGIKDEFYCKNCAEKMDQKTKRNAEYLKKLDDSVEQLKNGNTIILTMDEMQSMESDDWKPSQK